MAKHLRSTVQVVLILIRSHICDSVMCSGPNITNCECTSNVPCELELDVSRIDLSDVAIDLVHTHRCIGDDTCKGVHTFTCRSSQPCALRCDGEHACTNLTIVPNGASSVSVECIGCNACEDTDINPSVLNATYSLINSGCSSIVPAPYPGYFSGVFGPVF